MANVRALRAGKAVIELSLLSTGVEKGLKRLQSKTRDFGTSLKSIGSSGLKLSGAMGGLLAIPIRLAANMEKTRAEFTALIGDATTANKVISQLEGFALVTPLATADLNEAARTLLNFGVAVEDVVPRVKQLGEIAGGDSERMGRLAYAFGQVTAAGRLMGTEVRQFIEAGFNPLQEISRTTGESMESLRQRLEAGEISVAEVTKAFETSTGAGGRFNGLLAKIAGTSIGKFNELKESIVLAIRPIGDALLPMLNDLMRDVLTLVPAIAEWVKVNGDTIRSVAKMTVVVGALSAAVFVLGTMCQKTAALVGGLRIALMALYAHPVVAGLAATALAIGVIANEMKTAKSEGEKLAKVFDDISKNPKLPKFLQLFAQALNFSVGGGGGIGPSEITHAPVPFLNQPTMAGGGWYGAPQPGARMSGSPEFLQGLMGAAGGVLGQGWVEAQAIAMRAQFEALPVMGMVEAAKEAFKKGRELAEEAQRVDDEIARERINGMEDGLDKELAIIALEKQIRMRELQEAGQLTPEMRARLDALFGAQANNAKLEDLKGGNLQEKQAIFDTRFAGQIFGGGNEELAELRKIARNTDPRNAQGGGGIAVV